MTAGKALYLSVMILALLASAFMVAVAIYASEEGYVTAALLSGILSTTLAVYAVVAAIMSK